MQDGVIYYMPLYTNEKAQSEKEFINSCMSDSVMNKEFKDGKQRLAVCYSQYKKSKKSKKSKANWENQSDENITIIY